MEPQRTLTQADCKFPMTTEESRKVQLAMLNALVDFCDQHGLRYTLSGGTLLGAVRHQGFIPWDDDIDVNMPRPDCEKLYRISGGKIGKYRLEGPDQGEYMNCCNWFRIYDDDTVIENYRAGLTEKYPYYHPIFIDIFPVEGLPAGKLSCYFHWAVILSLNKMQRVSALKHMEARSVWRHIFHVITAAPAKLIGYRNWGKAIQKYSRRYRFDKEDYVGVTTEAHYITRERISKKGYLKFVKVIFEGREYNAPGNYDTYLTQLYGDYMKMPPVEKQKSDHVFKMYWRVRQS